MFTIYAKVIVSKNSYYTDVVKNIIANSECDAREIFESIGYEKCSIYNIVRVR